MSDLIPNNRNLRKVLLSLFYSRKTAAEAHRDLKKVYGNAALSETTCRDWFRRFKNGDFDVHDCPREGRPKTFEDAKLRELLDENPCQTQQQLASALRVTRQAISKRLHALGMIQKQGTWVLNNIKQRDLIIKEPTNNKGTKKNNLEQTAIPVHWTEPIINEIKIEEYTNDVEDETEGMENDAENIDIEDVKIKEEIKIEEKDKVIAGQIQEDTLEMMDQCNEEEQGGNDALKNWKKSSISCSGICYAHFEKKNIQINCDNNISLEQTAIPVHWTEPIINEIKIEECTNDVEDETEGMENDAENIDIEDVKIKEEIKIEVKDKVIAGQIQEDTLEMMDQYNEEEQGVTEEDEIAAIDYELKQIECEIQQLEDRKKVLLDRKQKLKDNALLKKSYSLANKNWNKENFSWSLNLKKALINIFKIKELRPLQLQTMNAYLSNEDIILVMPTGGGKSLCYQLPAVISTGITIVVSPLVALMEDQLYGLHKLKVNAMMLNSKVPKEDVKTIMTGLIDKKSDLKLVYVTPEYMAKSNRFMNKLQKAFEMKRLNHFAIDEVHCCSQWGHDFRPDYKFLGILKSMFPGIPILGLTATAPAKIIVDVQKMLDIQGCLVFRASFNRPNLFYEVRRKLTDNDKCVEMIVNLMTKRFSGKSGIIYTTTIKESEQLKTDLRSHGMKVGCYHAMLEAEQRTKVYSKWITGEYQAVVATIAFGLGIDKPDVRFIIHHCMSKSMENFYQESGRSGRDGQKATCILLFRLMDVFKLSTMVFQDKVGLQNLYKMLAYCLDQSSCRRSLIATHFEETWTKDDCKEMCDHCLKPKKKIKMDIGPFCRQLYQLITNAMQSEQRLTPLKLLDAWYNKGTVALRVKSVPTPKFPREIGEAVIGHLLINGYLQEDFHFSAYSTFTYLKKGPKSGLASVNDHKIIIEVMDYQ